MEKLIELLNEYHFFNTDCINYVLDKEENRIYLKEEFDGFYHEQRINAERIISKKFGFIQWLVENEKIDYSTRNPLFITELVGEQEKQIPYSFYEEMLIRLAVSDTPIEDLISYLK